MPDDSTEKLRLPEAERRLAASEIDDEVIRIRGYDSRPNVAVLRRLDYSGDQRQTHCLAIRTREQSAEEAEFEPTEPRSGTPVFEAGDRSEPILNRQSLRADRTGGLDGSSYSADRDLAEIVVGWHKLPDHLRRTIIDPRHTGLTSRDGRHRRAAPPAILACKRSASHAPS